MLGILTTSITLSLFLTWSCNPSAFVLIQLTSTVLRSSFSFDSALISSWSCYLNLLIIPESNWPNNSRCALAMTAYLSLLLLIYRSENWLSCKFIAWSMRFSSCLSWSTVSEWSLCLASPFYCRYVFKSIDFIFYPINWLNKLIRRKSCDWMEIWFD